MTCEGVSTASRWHKGILGAGLLLILIAAEARAQGGRLWVALDQTPPGTPAEVILDRGASTPQASTFDLFIHGFYVENKLGPDGQTYQKLDVPGLGHLDESGAPQLPAVPPSPIVIVTGAQDVRLQSASYIDVRALDGYNVWPTPAALEKDHLEGEPEEFARNDAIYRLQTPWPSQDGVASAPTTMMLGMPAAQLPLWPVKWNPASQQLLVGAHVRYVLSHAGNPNELAPLTRERARLASKRFINWTAVGSWIQINIIKYAGDFLFIYAPGFEEEIQPLVNQKKMRGYAVTKMTTVETGTSCASIQAAIDAWYAARPADSDKYCLLVGDTSVIPLCTAPNGDPTDDLYASTNGDDVNEEIFLGRLSIDSESDLTEQVEKILRYEQDPDNLCCYSTVMLAAHKEAAPGKYVGAHESVRTAFYSVPPAFTTQYGHQSGVTDATVSALINGGLGLVAYRGHGSSSTWIQWNLDNEDYSVGDVAALANPARRVPVLWSFACNNNELDVADCIGETWMEDPDNRAVSHYGSTVPSWTDPNHELDRQMFSAVYDDGLVVQSHAIEQAEANLVSTWGIWGEDNAWMYLLLGDPEMSIRRRNPITWVLDLPEWYDITEEFFDIRVMDPSGAPVAGAQISIWKPGEGPGKSAAAGGIAGGADEVFDNRYTDASGSASIPADPTSTGYIYYSIEDSLGNAIVDSIPVVIATDVATGAGVGGLSLTASPSVTRSITTLQFGQALPAPTTVELYNAAGQLVRSIDAALGSHSVKWDGSDAEGKGAPSGVYFARYAVGNQSDTARIVLVR